MDLQNQRSDEELMQKIRAGDEEAFLLLYRRRQAGIYQFALRMSGSRTIAEDVTQEVFMTLVRGPRRFDPRKGSAVAYLYGVARNQVMRSFGRTRNDVPMAETEEQQRAESLVSFDDPLRDLTRSETIETVRRAVVTLPVHYREVVVLCDLNSLTYADAAAALECAVGTVRSRLHRAHALLLEKLGHGQAVPHSEKLNPARCPV